MAEKPSFFYFWVMKFPPWTSVSEAARLLKEGEVVAIPTETVYGLAGNAYNPDALAKIFAAKERPTFDQKTNYINYKLFHINFLF